MQMPNPAPGELCSRYFQYHELLFCGETWLQYQPDNLPLQAQSWKDLSALSIQLLDPITERFEKPGLTYGFSGLALQRLILQKDKPQIAPKLDQHAASELNRSGKLICPRAGAAVDLIIPQLNSFELAAWIARQLPFDRLYIYGAKRPIHLSFHGAPTRQIVLLNKTTTGRVVPQRINLEHLESMAKEACGSC
jgi:hypothetical protein